MQFFIENIITLPSIYQIVLPQGSTTDPPIIIVVQNLSAVSQLFNLGKKPWNTVKPKPNTYPTYSIIPYKVVSYNNIWKKKNQKDKKKDAR